MADRKRQKKRTPLGRVARSLFATVVLAGALGVIAGFYCKTAFEAAGPLEEDKVFTVTRGMRTPAIAHGLKDAGIISDQNVFIAAAYATNTYRRMKAGDYYFPKNVPMSTVMGMIVQGKELTYKVSVPEGWTSSQVVDRLQSQDTLQGELESPPAEGTLLPDTYLYHRGATRQELVKEMGDAQEKLLNDLWENRAPGLPLRNREDAVILASIVERETAIPEERPRIAAVFINRLKAHMRLQSDPTIIYGITGGKSKLDRPILKSDIETKSPYNTYQIDGLPPTPIGNPGRESIAAVLNPLSTKDLYFVADGSGGHVFSATLEQHARNVEKWRGIEKDLKAKADDEAGSLEALAEASNAGENVTPPLPAPDPSPPAQEVADAAKTATLPLPQLKPGSVVKLAGRLVPIPLPRPKKN